MLVCITFLSWLSVNFHCFCFKSLTSQILLYTSLFLTLIFVVLKEKLLKWCNPSLQADGLWWPHWLLVLHPEIMNNGGMRLNKNYTYYMIKIQYPLILLVTLAGVKKRGNIKLFNSYCRQFCWDDMSGRIERNNHLSRKREGMKEASHGAEWWEW